MDRLMDRKNEKEVEQFSKRFDEITKSEGTIFPNEDLRQVFLSKSRFRVNISDITHVYP